MEILDVISILSTIVFAMGGVFVVSEDGLDVIGAITAGCLTAIGGGTMRDLLLELPVFWVSDPQLLYVSIASSVGAFMIVRYLGPPGRFANRLVLIMDAIGLSVFTAFGTAKALDFGASDLVAIVMGLLTSVGGGMLRDLCALRIPFVMQQKDLYATPAIIGAIPMVLLPYNNLWVWCLAAGLCFVIRVVAIFWDLSLPGFYRKR